MIIKNGAGDRLVLLGDSVTAVEGRKIYVSAIFDVVLAHFFLLYHLDQLYVIYIAVTPIGLLA